MMRVGLECDEPFLVQVVDDPLHVLAIGAEVAREPRDRLRAFGGDDGAEDLPAGARQAELGDQPVSGGKHSAVEPEQVENEIGQGIAGGRSLGAAHMSSSTYIDIIMSIIYVFNIAY